MSERFKTMPLGEARPLGTANPKGRKKGKVVSLPDYNAGITTGPRVDPETGVVVYPEEIKPVAIKFTELGTSSYVETPTEETEQLHEIISPLDVENTCNRIESEVRFLQSDEPTNSETLKDKVKIMEVLVTRGKDKKNGNYTYKIPGVRAAAAFHKSMFKEGAEPPVEITFSFDGDVSPFADAKDTTPREKLTPEARKEILAKAREARKNLTPAQKRDRMLEKARKLSERAAKITDAPVADVTAESV